MPTIFQVFDIMPLFGSLRAGMTDLMTLTFYGHAFVESGAVAVCQIVDGPSYEYIVHGSASELLYKLSTNSVDLGQTVSGQPSWDRPVSLQPS